ncbi:hypothetical protein Tco_0439450 [Tanacetum coccineum]
MYLVFSHMLKSFDKEDLETLWKLVKAKHGSTRPEEGYDRVLWGDLKTMFDPYVEDQTLFDVITGDGLANASYPFLAEVTADPYAFVEQLLSKKP